MGCLPGVVPGLGVLLRPPAHEQQQNKLDYHGLRVSVTRMGEYLDNRSCL